MEIDAKKLKQTLRQSGLSSRVIDAAWPEWWSDDANTSPSAKAELCFAVARKLGLSPKSLFDERVEFVWRDHARFKHVTAETTQERDALSSFGVSIGRLLISMTRTEAQSPPIQADQLRRAILSGNEYVDLMSLLSTCWAIGVPVIHLRVFPLQTKSMHAMVVRADGRYAILLGRDASYPAPVAFTLAHELGHLMLGHLAEGAAIVDLDDAGTSRDEADSEEVTADKYALSVLTGSEEPVIQPDTQEFGARRLAMAVLEAGPRARIEPGTLALCYAYQTNEWAKGISSLQFVYGAAKPVWKEVNGIAGTQLDWSAISDDTASYLQNVMGHEDA